MNNYGEVTVKAVELVQKGAAPVEAWIHAIEEVRKSAYVKPCARSAFLGLCTEGMILGCKKGEYSRGVKNKEYVIKALKYLMDNPHDIVLTPNQLWKSAKVSDTLTKQTGYQMDIARALYQNDLFDGNLIRAYICS